MTERPSFDPWLSHLRRDRRGLPVPWINKWGPEDVQQLALAYDPHVRQLGIFDDDGEQTVPDFTRQNMQRQRQAMAQGLCQVCARPVPWSRRNLVLSGMSVEHINWGGRSVPVVIEPWLDDRCCEIAVKWCPALIRRRRDEDLHVVRVRSPREVQLVVSTGWIDGPLEAESRRVQPAMWVKAYLLDVAVRSRTSTGARRASA